MGIARSRMKKVAPVSVTEESSDDRRHGHLLGPSNISVVPIRERVDYNSEGQDSEFSAEVERILAECENTDKRLNGRTFHEMPTLGSHGLCYAKQHSNDNIYRGSKHAELHVVCVKNYEVNKPRPTSNIQEHISPPNLLCSINIESTATALSHGIGDVSSLALPITYDASEEDLMNTIESEFG